MMGFRLTYFSFFLVIWCITKNVADSCDQVLTEDEGSFTSPGYPSNYTNHANCSYLIDVTDGKRILLEFTAFDVEYDGDCDYDRVTVYNGDSNSSDSIVGYYCGTALPRVPTSTGDKLFVEFTSDGSSVRPGFSAEYSAVDFVDISCDEILTEDEGSFTSPGYPSNYSSEVDCTYLIDVTDEKRISLEFTDFDVEFEIDCKYDFVTIYNGDSRSSPAFGPYCGDVKPPVLASTGDKMLVVINSDIIVNKPGFRAKYSAVDSLNRPVDAVFAVDISKNMKQHNRYESEKEFIKSVINKFELGEFKVKTAAVPFNNRARPGWTFNDQAAIDYLAAFDALDNFCPAKGDTHTEDGLRMASRYFKNHGRGERACSILVLITGAGSDNPAALQEAAEAFHNTNIKVCLVPVGIRSDNSTQELNLLAGGGEIIPNSGDVNDLSSMVDETVACISRCPTLQPECTSTEALIDGDTYNIPDSSFSSTATPGGGNLPPWLVGLGANIPQDNYAWTSKLNMCLPEGKPNECGWKGGIGDTITVDLGQVFRVESVATQGDGDESVLRDPEFVRQYKLAYSMDGVTFTEFNGGANFIGNLDGESVVRRMILDPTAARYIRLEIVSLNLEGILRWELYGCPAT